MFHIHCEVPKGWVLIVWFTNGRHLEYRYATRVFTNGRGHVVVVHGHADVGTPVTRHERSDVRVVSVREVWVGV